MRRRDPQPLQREGYCQGCKRFLTLFLVEPDRCAECARLRAVAKELLALVEQRWFWQSPTSDANAQWRAAGRAEWAAAPPAPPG